MSTPSPRMPATSLASARVTPGSMPYSRSPMSASPESFSSTRRNAGTLGRGPVSVSGWAVIRRGRSAGTRAPRPPRPASTLPTVCEPSWIHSWSARTFAPKKRLFEHPFDDLLTRLLGLRLHLVGVGDRSRARLRSTSSGTSSRAIQLRVRRTRCASRACAPSSSSPPRTLHEDAELVRRRVGVRGDGGRRRRPRSGRRRRRRCSRRASRTARRAPPRAATAASIPLGLDERRAPSCRTPGTRRSSRPARSRSRRRPSSLREPSSASR